ncbi:FHA domain-containing protein [Mycobacterium sp. 155]|uniref:FHA domain-containing protein n=1 Tax=Mycobacterium sp. 155 TaxID=1157943 RepID=UPI00038183E9|nr:FHA domain-containing protein [Mycobacterium sp. 155]
MSTTDNHQTAEFRVEDTTELLAPCGETIASVATALDHLDPLPPGAAMLVVKRGPAVGLQYRLHQPITTAGRHPRSDIYLDDITVSRLHAEFRCTNGEFQIIDTNSLNGTYLNRQPVDTATLTHGDEIQIGNFCLLFFTSTATH